MSRGESQKSKAGLQTGRGTVHSIPAVRKVLVKKTHSSKGQGRAAERPPQSPEGAAGPAARGVETGSG